MTAAATTRLIARYYAAFNAQDVEGMLACLGPGFVHDVSQGSRRRGKKLFAEAGTSVAASVAPRKTLLEEKPAEA